MFAEAEKYDAILIDEGHDFEPDWFRCAVGHAPGRARRRPDDRRRRRAEPLRPRPLVHLEVGRRPGAGPDAAAVAELPQHEADPGVRLAGGPVDRAGRPDETETHVRVLPTKASRRGPVPVYRGCATVAEEHALIARLVAGFRAKGLAERDIAVLYPRRERDRIDALCRRPATGRRGLLGLQRGRPERGRAVAGAPGRAAADDPRGQGAGVPGGDRLVAWTSCPTRWSGTRSATATCSTSGLTRATDHLAVTWAGQSAFTDRVLRSNKAGRLPG